MRPIQILSAALAALLATTALAKNDAPLLTVEAAVLDRHGKAVDGLQKEDFTVLYNGRPSEVESFHRVKSEQGEPAHVTLFFDELHLRRKSQKRAVDALRSYLERVDPRVNVSVVIWNGATDVRVRPTSDRAALRRGLDAVEREQPLGTRYEEEKRSVLRMIDHATETGVTSQGFGRRMADFAETHIGTTRDTIEALRRTISSLPGANGHKVLLYIGDALPLQPAAEVMEYGSHLLDRSWKERGKLDATGDLLALARAAKSAGVMLSAMELAEVGEAPAQSAARMLAQETGGRVATSADDLPASLSALADNIANVYHLQIRTLPMRHASVDVRVRKGDVQVLASLRQSMLQEESVNVSVRERLYSRESANPLEARVSFGAPWPDAQRCRLPVQVMIPPGKLTAGPDGHAEFSVRAMVLDQKQRESRIHYLVRKIVPRSDTAIMESIAFGLPASRYVVSLAILDHVTGETSYIQTEIDTSVCGS